MGSANFRQFSRKGKLLAILTVGTDLAKNVFALRGVNGRHFGGTRRFARRGPTIIQPVLTKSDLRPTFWNHP
jgi:hypothetical protein